MKTINLKLRIFITALIIFSLTFLGIPNLQAVLNESTTEYTEPTLSPPATQEKKEPEYVPGQLIVKLKKGKTIFDIWDLNTKYKVSSMENVFEDIPKTQGGIELAQRLMIRQRRAPPWAVTLDLSNIFLLKTAVLDTDILQMVQEYANNSVVEYAQPNFIAQAQLLPNDTYVDPDQDGEWSRGAWNQGYEDLWALKRIQADEAWDISQGSNVIVGVIDTGVDYNHQDFVGKVLLNYSYDFINNDNDPIDDNGHGTHVAGIIAAIGNNGRGIIGLAPEAKIMAIKGLDESEASTSFILARCLRYAADNGADIINCSWMLYGMSKVIEDAVNYAFSKGCIIVAAAGNSGMDAVGFCPASLREVITVGSSDYYDYKSYFSNWGISIDVVAPGGSQDWEIISESQCSGGRYAFSTAEKSPKMYFQYSLPWSELNEMTIYLNKGPNGGLISCYEELTQSYAYFDTYSPIPEFHVPFQMQFSEPQDLVMVDCVLDNPTADQTFALDSCKIDGKTIEETGSLVKGSKIELSDANYTGVDILSLRADNYGEDPFIVAGDYYRDRGTSASAAYVSGLAALILAKEPTLGNEAVRHIIRLSAKDLGTLGRDDYFGYGRINAYEALRIESINIMARILSPQFYNYAYYRKPLIITGYASGVNFKKYRLFVKNLATSQEELIRESSVPIEGGELGIWQAQKNVEPIDPEGFYEIRLDIETHSGLHVEDISRVILMDLQPGWPKTYDALFGIASYGDIDGDGANEIVAPGLNAVYAWELDGSEVVDGDNDPTTSGILARIPFHYQNLNYPPALGNIDSDPAWEIVVGTEEGVYAFKGNGGIVPGWPRETDENFIGYSEITPYSPPIIIADLDGDRLGEIIAATIALGAPSIAQIFTWDGDGTPLSYFAEQCQDGVTSIAVGDINSDRKQEIVVAINIDRVPQSGKIVAYSIDSGKLWEIQEGQIPEAIFLGNVDGNRNNGLEIVALYEYSATTTIHIFDNQGQLMHNWTIPHESINSVMAPLADLDRDGDLEIILLSGSYSSPLLFAYHHTSELMWSIVPEFAINPPVIADVNSDK